MAATSFMQRYLGADAPQRDSAEPVVHRRGQTYLARCLHQITLGAMSGALEGSGLVSMHWGVLRAIQLEPGIGQQRLCERQSIDPNSASRLVDELEAMGLVRREPVPSDRRAYALHLTEAGRRLRSRLRPLVLAAQDRVLEPLTEKERQLFLELLTRVVEGNSALVRPGNGRRRPARAARRPDEPGAVDSTRRAASPGTRRARP
ncbi:DNA-binding transcriptional regulator, MarR family [Variovorax sp. HW608]|uniref:MarR family winged helix-turn-helix transcriptional regulator n=1 Tax=Variovorax sp. HW608 TaxID=1034889 RepID=UPI00081FCA75|nr:MarR family winged helix-turn-helix transcriptional regulator [Variovorax sp. HW608]SCK57274.1 DNA-binding transcriptional regulator, MarR family [Variovorax sp. HW608]